jgi:hypothetical protein
MEMAIAEPRRRPGTGVLLFLTTRLGAARRGGGLAADDLANDGPGTNNMPIAAKVFLDSRRLISCGVGPA